MSAQSNSFAAGWDKVDMPALYKLSMSLTPAAPKQFAFPTTAPAINLPGFLQAVPSTPASIVDSMSNITAHDALISTATVFTTITLNVTTPPATLVLSTATKTYTSFVLSAAPAPTATVLDVIATVTGGAGKALPTAVSAPSPLGGHTGGLGHPNADQIKLIWVAAVMLVSLILGWNMVLVRDALYPWKMWVNAIHEGSHLFVGILTGAKIFSVSIDPDNGPISGMTNGHPLAILLSGYLGSILIGSGLIMCAFDITASKIAALVVYPVLLICFWFGRTWARIRVLACMGVSVAMFFIHHASVLRYYVMFLGVMNAAYLLWDVIDDRIFRKSNESDVALLARITPIAVHTWILIWLAVSMAFTALAIVGALHFFDRSLDAQIADQRNFLWT